METQTNQVDLVGTEAVRNIVRAALFAALAGAAAYVSFPNPLSAGVPVTLQVLAVFLAGIYLGPTYGFASMALYIVAGAAGVPVFSGGTAGLGQLLGPTGGYLWSYPFAAAVIGALVHGRTLDDPSAVSTLRLVSAMVGGVVVIYAFGITGLYLATPMGLVAATVAGAAAFVPVEIVKIAAAVAVVRSDAASVE